MHLRRLGEFAIALDEPQDSLRSAGNGLGCQPGVGKVASSEKLQREIDALCR